MVTHVSSSMLLLCLECSLYVEHVVQSLLNKCLFGIHFWSCQTTYHSNIGFLIIKENQLNFDVYIKRLNVRPMDVICTSLCQILNSFSYLFVGGGLENIALGDIDDRITKCAFSYKNAHDLYLGPNLQLHTCNQPI